MKNQKQFKKIQEQIELLLRMTDEDYSLVRVNDILKDTYRDFLKLKYYIVTKEESKEKEEDK